MKKEFIIYSILILIIPISIRAQKNQYSTEFWRIYSYSGEARLNGYYRKQDRKGNQINESQKSSLVSTGILLKTKNYIWHPRFIVLDIDGEYSPTKANEKFLVIPDQAENSDLKKFDARLSLFPQNKLSLSSFYNYGQVYNNRENLSSLKSQGNNWASTLFCRTKMFPFSVGYSSLNLNQTEIQTQRRFQNKQHNLEGRMNTSFGKSDKHELLVAHNEFYRMDFNKTEVVNKVDNFNYNNSAFLGKKKQHNLNTFLSGIWQKGNDTFKRYQANENINWKLSRSLQLGTNYALFSDQRSLQTIKQHKIGINLHHQLYESLQSQLVYDYSTTRYSLYNEGLHQGSLGFIYTKKLLKNHRLDISFRHNFQAHKWSGDDGLISVFNEPVQIKDGEITLISRPYISISSVRVNDVTGTIIYQQNLDYQLIQQNNYLQILRVAGGQIPNNTTIYVNYTAVQPGNYQFLSTNNLFKTSVSFFNRLFGIYYNKSVQDYHSLKNIDLVTLNYFNQQVIGVKFEYRLLAGGIESDHMKSTILPYKLLRYYINLQGTLKRKIVFSLNGNIYDYKKLNDKNNVKYIDAGGSAVYHFTPRISLMTSLNYRKQNGEGVDLNLFSSRTEFNAIIHRIRLSVIYNYYDRNIFNEVIHFNAFNIQILRKF